MTVAKGRTLEDGTYIYTCGKCGGKGQYKGAVCPDCYGLDIDAIRIAMQEGSRGQRYYALLKAFLSVQGKAIVDEFRRVKDEQGNMTRVDLGYFSLKFGLNFKATCEWLEETGCLPTGIYEQMADRGVKVRDVYAYARQKYPELEVTP